MKKYEAVVKEVFEAYKYVQGQEFSDFSINSYSPQAMVVQVWLDYKDNKAVRETTIKLTEGTKMELSSKVAFWFRDVDWAGIPEGFNRWEDLNSDVD